jgi:phage repressor protein C with HTH and peptisase S24 domain
MGPAEPGWTAQMDTPAKRLQWALDLRQLESAAEAARLTGIPESTMRTYLLGTRKPPLEKCEEIGAALRINPRWLHKGEGSPELSSNQQGHTLFNAGKFERVPLTERPRLLRLYSSALAGPLGEFMLDTENAGVVPAPPMLHDVQDAYAVHIVGDSMDPRYCAGEIVFVHPWKPVRRNDYVVVQLYHDGNDGAVAGMVKRFVRQTADDVTLEQLNPAREISLPAKVVKSIHRIVGSSEG